MPAPDTCLTGIRRVRNGEDHSEASLDALRLQKETGKEDRKNTGQDNAVPWKPGEMVTPFRAASTQVNGLCQPECMRKNGVLNDDARISLAVKEARKNCSALIRSANVTAQKL